MKSKTYPFFITLLLITILAAPAAAEMLTVRDALLLGMSENYDLKIASLDVERAEAGVTGEQGRFDVIAELGISIRHNELPADSAVIDGNTLTTEQAEAEAALSKQFATGLQTRLRFNGMRSDADGLADRLDPAYRTSLVLDFTQPLLKDMGSDINTTNLMIARTRQQQAAYGYLGSALQLAADIENTYLDLAQTEADYDYAVLARDLAKELLDGNQKKFAAGLVPITEVNEARTAVALREEVMLLNQQRIVMARSRLLELVDHGKTVLPDEWQTEIPVVENAHGVELDQALAVGLRQRPELQQARLELKARKIALVYADNQQLPRLDLEASLGLNGLSGNAASNTYYDGPWQDSLSSDGNSWYAGLRLSMPLQNRAAKAQFRDAAARDKQSLYRLRRAEISAETAIRSAHATLQLGKQRLEVARQTAQLAKNTLEQENRRLQEGLSDTFRVLNFQSSLIDARVSEVAALTDYHRARASLFQAMGANLEYHNIVAALPHQGAMP